VVIPTSTHACNYLIQTVHNELVSSTELLFFHSVQPKNYPERVPRHPQPRTALARVKTAALKLTPPGVARLLNSVFVFCEAEAASLPLANVLRYLPRTNLAARPAFSEAFQAHAVVPTDLICR
jgi:hypothetical protein